MAAIQLEKPAISPLVTLARTVLLCAALALGACAKAGVGDGPQAAAKPLGLFTSLPIYWSESADLHGLLRSDAPPHWALAALRRHGDLRLLDSLGASGLDGQDGLANIATLVMAQPRALSGAENVALDAWVRGGGRLLLFADPMLTGESAYPIGDKRRPPDVVLLSPILTHWKLRLEFDEDQPAGEHVVDAGGIALPVNLPGRLLVAPGSRHCTVQGDGVLALCRLGKGWVLLIADAALLEQHGDPLRDGRSAVLERLLDRLAVAQ